MTIDLGPLYDRPIRPAERCAETMKTGRVSLFFERSRIETPASQAAGMCKSNREEDEEMRRRIAPAMTVMLAGTALLLSGGAAWAQEDPVANALEVCAPEIETYCSQVTPGEGRLLACFVAYEDKLSGQCSWALYEAMQAFEEFANAVTYVATSCWDDIVEYCGEVEMGEGRVATCLLENQDSVTPECQQAMEDVELEVIDE